MYSYRRTMNMPINFKLPVGVGRKEVEAALAGAYPYVAEPPGTMPWRLYDTFDWRLFNRSLMLCQSGTSYTLAPLAGGPSLRSDVESGRPTFAWDFPHGDLRSALAPILQERALLELTSVTVEETTYRVLNDEQKTVARLVCCQVYAEPGSAMAPPDTYVSVRPLRGYEEKARRLARDLDFGEAINSIDEALYVSAMMAAGQTPSSYSSQFNVRLDPAMRADEATKAILQRLLETMRANEAGIRADIDTEFLHDYRVAVRRTRSALNQIRNVFPEETTTRFKQDFRTLGSLTSELRDLDVYLLAEADFRARLPDALRDDITSLFDLLRRRRAEALDRVIQGLADERYEQFLADWGAFLAEPGSDDTPAANADFPIINLARTRIDKQYRRIVKDGSTVLDHTEDELLHALRLECKRLRYLLEFFASLFPPGEVTSMIGQLKRLQDNLGEFTDLAVQQKFLLTIAEMLDIEAAGARRALIATGFLVESMAGRQQDVKANFAATFREFASPGHRKRFRKLIAEQKKNTS